MSSALDVLDDQDGESGEEVEAMTASEVLQKLEQAWFKRKIFTGTSGIQSRTGGMYVGSDCRDGRQYKEGKER